MRLRYERPHKLLGVRFSSMKFSRETLRIRFLNVIRGAGYTGEAPESICNHYLAEYMKDVPSFVDMLHRYETQDYDPE